MKCPKCNTKNVDFHETRLDVVVYNWYAKEDSDEEDSAKEDSDKTIPDKGSSSDPEETHYLDDTDHERSLLTLSVTCRVCHYTGTPGEFGIEGLSRPLQEDEGGKYVVYHLKEAKIKVYPNEALLKDIKD